MKKLNYLLVFVIVISLGACVTYYPNESNLSSFTAETATQITKAGIDIRKIQFYNSHEIVLQREISSTEAKVAEGKVEMKDGKFVETIVIPRLTPAICEFASASYLNISFEEGKHLRFGKRSSSPSYFQIHASSWKNGFGKWEYGGKTFYILPSGSQCRLMIEKNHILKIKEEKRVVGGRTVD